MHHEEPPEDTAMTEQLEIRIPLNDLTKMAIECPRCQAETILDISDPKHRGIKEDPNQGFFCTVCMNQFDSQLRQALISAFAWYDAIKVANLIEKISFRIKKTVQ
jgi:transposase-like protein